MNRMFKKIIILLIGYAFSMSAFSFDNNSFIIGVETDNPGSSAVNEFTIPVKDNYDYDYQVDCDMDGNYEVTGETGSYTCTYPPGSSTARTIAIDGTFPRIYFNDEGDKKKLISVEQWGTQQWQSMGGAFWGAENLVYVNGIPDLSQLIVLDKMFSGAVSLEYVPDINDWDVSAVIYMGNMFSRTTKFNEYIGDWDVSNVELMHSMFSMAVAFNRDISAWNVSKVTTFNSMFSDAAAFNQDIGGWDVSNVNNMYIMFNNAAAFNQDIGDWNVSKVNDMENMFNGAHLSISNYDNLLISWEKQVLLSDVILDAGNSEYCNGEIARASLTDAANVNWTITDAGILCHFHITSANTMSVKNGESEVGVLTSTNGINTIYEITGGADGDKFSISNITKVLSFIEAPDAAEPMDKNHNNVYRVQVKATAMGSEDLQTIRVSVGSDGAIVSILNYLLL